MLRDFSLRDFGASLNTVESYTNESSQGKIGLCETVNKQKCTHLGMFLASVIVRGMLHTDNVSRLSSMRSVGLQTCCTQILNGKARNPTGFRRWDEWR